MLKRVPEHLPRLTYTVGECSSLLGVSADSIYEKIRRHELPAVRFGRKIVVPRIAISRLLEEQPA